MNVKLRPAPTRVNAILGCPSEMVRNGYYIPIFFLFTSGIVFRTRLGFRKSWCAWLSCVHGGWGAGVVYVARSCHHGCGIFSIGMSHPILVQPTISQLYIMIIDSFDIIGKVYSCRIPLNIVLMSYVY